MGLKWSRSAVPKVVVHGPTQVTGP